jgi:hypothetical protein
MLHAVMQTAFKKVAIMLNVVIVGTNVLTVSALCVHNVDCQYNETCYAEYQYVDSLHTQCGYSGSRDAGYRYGDNHFAEFGYNGRRYVECHYTLVLLY